MIEVTSKIEEIARDLSHNVTRIYGRDDVIIAADLAFHSVLGFNFRDEEVTRGWVEIAVLGDTGSGKSQTLKALHEHYRAGEFITGEDVSRAGLVGGLQQLGGRWMITWGRYVRQNRELCTIDEVQNLTVEDIANMTGMRSSGVAEITMVKQAKTEAKVRSIWLGNPRSNRYMNTYSYGIVALRDLIGKLDDIRRFDLAVACSVDEISPDEYNRVSREPVEHKYTSDACHNLIRWCWSREPDQVVFADKSDLLILDVSKELSRKYTSQIPLVAASEMRIKLARLSVATAARVFSTDESHEMVVVRPEHVEFVKGFLCRCYNKGTMGYDVYTNVEKAKLHLPNEDEVMDYVARKGVNFLDSLLEYDYIGLTDIQDFMGTDREDAREIVSHLVQNKCIRKYHQQYLKNPAFNRLLKRMKDSLLQGKQTISDMKLGFEGEDEDQDQDTEQTIEEEMDTLFD